MKYEIRNLINVTYQVYEYTEDSEEDEGICVYQGSLSECEAYLNFLYKGTLQ